jgi:hypothetical protein
MESVDVPTALLRLAETLAMLAAPAAEQIEWSAAHGSSDELALDFEWATGWTIPLIVGEQPRLISPALRRLIGAIDDQLTQMSGHHNADRWTDEALMTDPGWHHVRAMATEVIQEIESLGVIVTPPGPGRSDTPT